MGCDDFLWTVGRTEEELEQDFNTAREECISGRSTASWRVADSEQTRHIWMELAPRERLRILAQALYRLNPTKYPLDDILPLEVVQVGFREWLR